MIDNEKEKWAGAYQCPGYQVSDLGRFKSLYRVVVRSNGRPHTTQEAILKPSFDTKGYLQVSPYISRGVKKTISLHRLVFQSFVRPLKRGEHVDHIDRNPSNSRLDNLQVVKGHFEHWKITWGRIYKDYYLKGYEQAKKDFELNGKFLDPEEEYNEEVQLRLPERSKHKKIPNLSMNN